MRTTEEIKDQMTITATECGNLFDKEYYENRSGVRLESVELALQHYISQGWLLGLSPSEKFSTSGYLNAYPDVARSGINPLEHYIRHGKSEGRSPVTGELMGQAEKKEAPKDGSELMVVHLESAEDDYSDVKEHFDENFYLEQSEDLQGVEIDLWEHFLEHGWREHRNPNREFSTADYLEANPDLQGISLNPFVHWIRWGMNEGRSMSNEERPANKSSQEIESFGLDLNDLDKVMSAFDAEYYRANSKDLSGADDELFSHYMNHGWREHRNPSKYFSTSYYLEANPDIRDAGINPFVHFVLHGQYESRSAVSYAQQKLNIPFSPLVSAIVPNYNHARFLRERIKSIESQTYQNLEIIILDDCSTDNSRELIDEIVANSSRISRIFNEKNSGGVFYQWQKGIAAAKGEIIWICESDDTCDKDFLSNLIPHLADPSVMIAFGRIQFCNEKGIPYEGLDGYRESAERGIWSAPCTRSAAEWFSGAFATSNIIPNVGGCVFRKAKIEESVWQKAISYRISADWYLYMEIAQGGRIAYEPKSVAYFRQHGKNTSVTGFLRREYYTEHEQVAIEIRKKWGVSAQVISKLYSNVVGQYEYVKAEDHVGPIDGLISLSKILRQKKERRHILIAFLGFHLGGGELFPINLSNELLNLGYTVSVLALDGNEINQQIRSQLDRRVAVYESQLVNEIGVDEFIRQAGIDLIHSHAVALEFFFFQKNRLSKSVPYLVSLHGSYEVTQLPDDLMFRVLKGVDHWFYLARKNLAHFEGLKLDCNHITPVVNGMPMDERPFPKSRKELGIDKGTFVFGIASRAINEKGWVSAAKATALVSQRTGRKVKLLLCGEGPDFKEIESKVAAIKEVALLGFQDCIHGFYRIIDCAMLPSRFKGESFPLALIQAMQVGLPIVSTRIGEIPKMLEAEDEVCGILVDPLESDEDFVEKIADAMISVMDVNVSRRLAKVSKKFGQRYDLSVVAQHYAEFYDRHIGLAHQNS